MPEPRKSFIERIGADAFVTATIAIVSVIVVSVAFYEHTRAFEGTVSDTIKSHADRITALELHNFESLGGTTRLEVQMEHLREDIDKLSEHVDMVYRILTETTRSHLSPPSLGGSP